MHTSEKVKRARAMFGLPPRGWHAQRAQRVGRAAAAIDRLLRPGETALITGPSGAGKSTLGRALAARLGIAVSAAPARTQTRVLDLFGCDLQRAMSLLARAGLSEARVMVARERDLSEGQRARLAIALAMDRAMEQTGPTLILDEFASTLDRPTAAGLARTVRKWARESGARVVCITAHGDVLEWLGPAVLAVVGEEGAQVSRCQGVEEEGA